MKMINILSYLLNIFLVTYFVAEYIHEKDEETPGEPETEEVMEEEPQPEKMTLEQYIYKTIIDKERAETPIHVQEFEKVYSISVDSIVFTDKINLTSGYLVTKWNYDEKQRQSLDEIIKNGYNDKYIRRNKTVYVELDHIHVGYDDHVSWFSEWLSAYMNIREIH